MRVLVTGSQGFIGHHLVRYLKNKGYWVRGVDWKDNGYTDADEFLQRDLRIEYNAKVACGEVDEVYHLAADMGGMGFIQDPKNQAKILYNNTMINFNVLEASRHHKVKKFFFSSSACVYPNYLQDKAEIISLKESDAYPADPQDTYGWEKLQMEHLCKAYRECYDMNIKVARYHNIYGPEGDYDSGREKAPAALARKVIFAIKEGKDEIEIWGDGTYVRSFCFIRDCLKATFELMHSDCNEPVNIGRNDGITINDLAEICIKIGGKKLKIKHISGPLGVKGRNSDNTLFKKYFGWEPGTSMQEGMLETYNWIEAQINGRK